MILVAYNSWADLERCIPSILAALKPDGEVIVVDNHSTDGTVDRLSVEFPQVKLVVAAENLGFGAGCNLGARAAAGEYLAFLNPDTVVTPGWLEALIAPLEQDSGVGMTTPRILQLNAPKKINTCGNEVHMSGMALCRDMGRDADAFPVPEEVNSISGAAFAVSRAYFFELGQFDPTFFLYVEDTDLSLRCWLNGKRILYVPDALIYHDYKLTFGARKVYYQERNRVYMLQKLFSPATLKRLAPVLFFVEVMTWGFCLLHGKREIQNKVEAAAWVKEHQAQIQREFATTQLLRRISDYELVRRLGWKIDFRQTVSPLAAFFLSCLFYPFFFLSGKISLVLLKLMKTQQAQAK